MMKGTHASFILGLALTGAALANEPVIVTNGSTTIKGDNKSTIIDHGSVPPAPTSVGINTDDYCTFLQVSWSAVSGVTSYIVYLEENPLPWLPGFANQYTVAGTKTTKLVKEQLGGHWYLAKVASCNANGCSAPSTVTGSGLTPNFCP